MCKDKTTMAVKLIFTLNILISSNTTYYKLELVACLTNEPMVSIVICTWRSVSCLCCEKLIFFFKVILHRVSYL